jgi:Helix-turn-helix domain
MTHRANVQALGPKLITEKLLLTPEEAAKLLGIGRSRVYDLMRAHVLLSERWAEPADLVVAKMSSDTEEVTAVQIQYRPPVTLLVRQHF